MADENVRHASTEKLLAYKVEIDRELVARSAAWPPPAPGTHESDLGHIGNARGLAAAPIQASVRGRVEYYAGYEWSQRNTPKESPVVARSP